MKGFVYTYGNDFNGYFGAVIAKTGAANAGDNSRIIENYSKVEYYNETYSMPYQGGKNMDKITSTIIGRFPPGPAQ